MKLIKEISIPKKVNSLIGKLLNEIIPLIAKSNNLNKFIFDLIVFSRKKMTDSEWFIVKNNEKLHRCCFNKN